jgi:hypothetical protein
VSGSLQKITRKTVGIFLVRKTSIEEEEGEHFLKRRVHIKNSL